MRYSHLVGTRLYVGNLTEDVVPEELEEVFKRYGKVNNVWVGKNPPG